MPNTKTTTGCARIALLVLAPLWAASAYAQGADPNANYPQYPQPAAYPPANAMPTVPSPGQTMRSQFAASLMQVAQVGGSTAVLAVADGLTGALRDWFDRRRQRQARTAGYAPVTSTGAGIYPAPASIPPAYAPNAPPAGGQYPGADGSMAADSGMQGPNMQGPYTQDPSMGAPNYGMGDPGAAPPTNKSQLYAGIAYEIHLVNADGSMTGVDPATYSFRTGDRFRVYYRPALPGRVDVFNVNAAGQNSQIDNVNVAAGELATMGPYEFARLTGDETLILRLSACMTPSMVAPTRDIVKAADASPAPIQFASCSEVVTRGIRKTKVRDIQKVSVEGGTSFALDEVSAGEMSSGQYAPRQVTITLHHR